MREISIIAAPNQRMTVELDGSLWEVAIKQARGVMFADVRRDDEALILGHRLVAGGLFVPYQHLAIHGNFTITTSGGDLPWWEAFGVTQRLFYIEPGEM